MKNDYFALRRPVQRTIVVRQQAQRVVSSQIQVKQLPQLIRFM